MARLNGPKIVTNGLVLYLDAANVRSSPGNGTVWTDLSKNGNNGTLVNGPTFDANNGGSIVFDGTNDYVSTAKVIPNLTTFTFSLWYRGTGGGYLSGIFYNTMTFLGGAYMQVHESVRTIGAYNTGQWTQLAMVATDTQDLGYRQGVLVLSSTASIYRPTYSRVLVIGARGAGGTPTGFSAGKFNNVMLYNRALSAEEIRQNFNATRERFGV